MSENGHREVWGLSGSTKRQTRQLRINYLEENVRKAQAIGGILETPPPTFPWLRSPFDNTVNVA